MLIEFLAQEGDFVYCNGIEGLLFAKGLPQCNQTN